MNFSITTKLCAYPCLCLSSPTWQQIHLSRYRKYTFPITSELMTPFAAASTNTYVYVCIVHYKYVRVNMLVDRRHNRLSGHISICLKGDGRYKYIARSKSFQKPLNEGKDSAQQVMVIFKIYRYYTLTKTSIIMSLGACDMLMYYFVCTDRGVSAEFLGGDFLWRKKYCLTDFSFYFLKFKSRTRARFKN